ncbi:hypothetical protein ABZ801_34125 [Actinomadura sp. NPDC047616]|uniref:hypothetical protein n=1 Tax=Actinomadura sp. NPDC047616 TaxID=3155914 RepID=UPI0034088FCD
MRYALPATAVINQLTATLPGGAPADWDVEAAPAPALAAEPARVTAWPWLPPVPTTGVTAIDTDLAHHHAKARGVTAKRSSRRRAAPAEPIPSSAPPQLDPAVDRLVS